MLCPQGHPERLAASGEGSSRALGSDLGRIGFGGWGHNGLRAGCHCKLDAAALSGLPELFLTNASDGTGTVRSWQSMQLRFEVSLPALPSDLLSRHAHFGRVSFVICPLLPQVPWAAAETHPLARSFSLRNPKSHKNPGTLNNRTWFIDGDKLPSRSSV